VTTQTQGRVICSGLGSAQPCCPKRDACANYKHWTEDPRSVFRACLDNKFQHFVPLNATPVPGVGQQELFA
jgi:hypothetical protein